MRKVVSIIVAIAFLASLMPANAQDLAGTGGAAYDITYAGGTLADFEPDSFTIPSHLGEVKYKFAGKADRFVIHIQDAHCNYYAQKRIADIIAYLNNEYGIRTINLEGGVGDYDLSVFTGITGRAIRSEVSDYFVKKGDINGAEYFAINNPDRVTLWGVEDKELYTLNLEVYRDSLKYKGEVDLYLGELKNILNKLKRHIFSPDLIKMDAAYAAYKTGSMEFRGYFEFLMNKAAEEGIDASRFRNLELLNNAMSRESAIDFKKANTERNVLIDELEKKLSKKETKDLVTKTLYFKTERISRKEFFGYLIEKARETGLDLKAFPMLAGYLEYVSIYESVDQAKVMDEINGIESAIKEKLFKNSEDRELDQLSRHLVLLENIFAFMLTKSDYKYYLDNISLFDIAGYTDFITKESRRYRLEERLSPSVIDLDNYRGKIMKFYEYSFMRDEVFLDNMRFDLLEGGMRGAILLTGGFHTENLCGLFEKEGIQYVSVLPKFTSGEDYECPYFELLGGKTSPLQDKLKMVIARVSTLALYSKLNSLAGDIIGRSGLEAFKAAVVIEELSRKENKKVIITDEKGEKIFPEPVGTGTDGIISMSIWDVLDRVHERYIDSQIARAFDLEEKDGSRGNYVQNIDDVIPGVRQAAIMSLYDIAESFRKEGKAAAADNLDRVAAELSDVRINLLTGVNGFIAHPGGMGIHINKANIKIKENGELDSEEQKRIIGVLVHEVIGGFTADHRGISEKVEDLVIRRKALSPSEREVLASKLASEMQLKPVWQRTPEERLAGGRDFLKKGEQLDFEYDFKDIINTVGKWLSMGAFGVDELLNPYLYDELDRMRAMESPLYGKVEMLLERVYDLRMGDNLVAIGNTQMDYWYDGVDKDGIRVKSTETAPAEPLKSKIDDRNFTILRNKSAIARESGVPLEAPARPAAVVAPQVTATQVLPVAQPQVPADFEDPNYFNTLKGTRQFLPLIAGILADKADLEKFRQMINANPERTRKGVDRIETERMLFNPFEAFENQVEEADTSLREQLISALQEIYEIRTGDLVSLPGKNDTYILEEVSIKDRGMWLRKVVRGRAGRERFLLGIVQDPVSLRKFVGEIKREDEGAYFLIPEDAAEHFGENAPLPPGTPQGEVLALAASHVPDMSPADQVKTARGGRDAIKTMGVAAADKMTLDMLNSWLSYVQSLADGLEGRLSGKASEEYFNRAKQWLQTAADSMAKGKQQESAAALKNVFGHLARSAAETVLNMTFSNDTKKAVRQRAKEGMDFITRDGWVLPSAVFTSEMVMLLGRKMGGSYRGINVPHRDVNTQIRGLFADIEKRMREGKYDADALKTGDLFDLVKLKEFLEGHPDVAARLVMEEGDREIKRDVEIARMENGEYVLIANGIKSHAGRESGQVWVNREDIELLAEQLIQNHHLAEDDARKVALEAIVTHEKLERDALMEKARARLGAAGYGLSDRAVIDWLEGTTEIGDAGRLTTPAYNSMLGEAHDAAVAGEFEYIVQRVNDGRVDGTLNFQVMAEDEFYVPEKELEFTLEAEARVKEALREAEDAVALAQYEKASYLYFEAGQNSLKMARLSGEVGFAEGLIPELVKATDYFARASTYATMAADRASAFRYGARAAHFYAEAARYVFRQRDRVKAAYYYDRAAYFAAIVSNDSEPENAGVFLRASADYYEEAARLYEDTSLSSVEPADGIVNGIIAADNYTRAAEILMKYGDKIGAAKVYEKAGDRFAEAMKSIEKSEPLDIAASHYSAKTADAYEKAGEIYALLAEETATKGVNTAISKEAAGYFTAAGTFYDKASLYTLAPELKKKSDLLVRSAEAQVSAAEKSRLATDTKGELENLARASTYYGKASAAAYAFDADLAANYVSFARHYLGEAEKIKGMTGTAWVPEPEEEGIFAINEAEFAREMETESAREAEELEKQADSGIFSFAEAADAYYWASEQFTIASGFATERGDVAKSEEYRTRAEALTAKAEKSKARTDELAELRKRHEERVRMIRMREEEELEREVEARYEAITRGTEEITEAAPPAPMAEVIDMGAYRPYPPGVSPVYDEGLTLAALTEFTIDADGVKNAKDKETKDVEKARAVRALGKEARKRGKAVAIEESALRKAEELLDNIIDGGYDAKHYVDIKSGLREQRSKWRKAMAERGRPAPAMIPIELYLSSDIEKLEIPAMGIKGFKLNREVEILSYRDVLADGSERIVLIVNDERGRFKDYKEMKKTKETKDFVVDGPEALAQSLRHEYIEAMGWLAHSSIKRLEMAENGFNAATEANVMLIYHTMLDRFMGGFQKLHPDDPKMRGGNGEELDHGYLYEAAIKLMRSWAKEAWNVTRTARNMAPDNREVLEYTEKVKEEIAAIFSELRQGYIYNENNPWASPEKRTNVPRHIKTAVEYAVKSIGEALLQRAALPGDKEKIRAVVDRALFLSVVEGDIRSAFKLISPLMNGKVDEAYGLAREFVPPEKMAINLRGEDLPHETAGGIEGVNDKIRGLFERVREGLGNAGYGAELEKARLPKSDRYGNPVYDLEKLKVLLEKTGLDVLADVEVREVDGELVVIAQGIISHAGRETGQVWINRADINDKVQTLLAVEGLSEKEAENVAVRSIILHEKVERNTLLERALKKMKEENPESATTPDAVVAWLEARENAAYRNMMTEAQLEAEKAETNGTGIMLAADSCRSLVEESRPGVQPGIILIPVVADAIRYIEERGQYEALVKGAWRALKKDYGVNIRAIYYRVDKDPEISKIDLAKALEEVAADRNFARYDLSRVLVYKDESMKDVNIEFVKDILGDKLKDKVAGVVNGEFTIEAQERFSIVSLVILGLGIMDWHRAESTGRYAGDLEKRIKDLFVRMVENPQEFRGMDAKELVKKLQGGLLLMRIKKINYEEIREFMEAESAVLESL